MIICDKLKKLFRKEEKSHIYEGRLKEPINYLGVSFDDIKRDSVEANKKIDENIVKLKRKLPKLNTEELETELKAVRNSMNTEEYGMIRKLFPQDIFRLMDGHLKSYRDEIEKELKKRQSSE